MVPGAASDATFLDCSSSTSAITTRAPSAAKPSVIARPRFDAPPVTMTTRPVNPRSTGQFWRKAEPGRSPRVPTLACFFSLSNAPEPALAQLLADATGLPADCLAGLRVNGAAGAFCARESGGLCGATGGRDETVGSGACGQSRHGAGKFDRSTR